MKKALLQIFATKVGWLGLSGLSLIIFAILSNFYDWAQTGMLISIIWPVVWLLIGIVYAWIINPIRDRKRDKAEQGK